MIQQEDQIFHDFIEVHLAIVCTNPDKRLNLSLFGDFNLPFLVSCM